MVLAEVSHRVRAHHTSRRQGSRLRRARQISKVFRSNLHH